MARTALAYFRNLLDASWQTDVTGRLQSVPEPRMELAADVDVTRIDTQAEDIIFVRDGGAQGLTPKSVGWSEKEIETAVTLDIRTTLDRGRLEGIRDNNNEAERYGGLRGETERILDSVRKGDKEYDWIDGYEWNDLSEDMGYGTWRGTWEVRLTQLAKSIDPEP